MKLSKFIAQKIKKTGHTQASLADMLGRTHNCFRQDISKGSFFEDDLLELSKAIDVTVEELKSRGVIIKTGPKRRAPSKDDILPILKKIVEADLKSITFDELQRLIRLNNKVQLTFYTKSFGEEVKKKLLGVLGAS